MNTLRRLVKASGRSRSSGFNAQAYRDAEFFQLEQKSIFRNNWVPVTVSNRRHKATPVSLGPTNLIVMNEDGQDRAFVNACSHRRCKLLKKPTDAQQIVCPYHLWNFSLDGTLKKAPRVDEFKDKEFRDRHKLEQVECAKIGHVTLARVLDDLHMDANTVLPAHAPEGLEEALVETQLQYRFGEPFQRICDTFKSGDMQAVRHKTFNVSANWKLLVENFMEYLHVPSVHPDLAKSSRVRDHHDNLDEGPYHIAFKTDPVRASSRTPLGGKISIPDHVPPRFRQTLHFDVLFPNFFHFMDGAHGVCVFVNPISPTESREELYLIMAPEVIEQCSEEEIDSLFEFYTNVNQEDINVVERVQEGIDGSGSMSGSVMSYLEPWDCHIRRYNSMLLNTLVSHAVTDGQLTPDMEVQELLDFTLPRENLAETGSPTGVL